MGMDVGEPDLRLSIRYNGVYHMFYLELKKKKGRISPSQEDWRDDFRKNFECENVKWDIAYGLQEAQDKIVGWLNSFTTPNPHSLLPNTAKPKR